MPTISKYIFVVSIVVAMVGSINPTMAQQFDMRGNQFSLKDQINPEQTPSFIGGSYAYWEGIIAQNTCEAADIQTILADTPRQATCDSDDLNCYHKAGLQRMAICLSRGVPCDAFADDNDLYVRCLLHPISPFQDAVIFHDPREYNSDWHNSTHGKNDQIFVEQLIRDLSLLTLNDFSDREAMLSHQSLTLPERRALRDAFAKLEEYAVFEPNYPARGAVWADRIPAHQLFMSDLSQGVIGHITTIYGFARAIGESDIE